MRIKHKSTATFFQLLVGVIAVPLAANLPALAAQPEQAKRPLLWVSFSGSSNEPGQVYKIDPTVGYRLSSHFEIDAGIPIYFVHASNTGVAEGFTSKNGIGNAYVDLRVIVNHPTFYFSSTLRGAAPTGDSQNGFSTGRATVDWSNYLEKSIGGFTPFGSAGMANTISDTHFFQAPFTSLGIVGHFEGGAYLQPVHYVKLGGSAYAMIPSGEQKVYSKLLKRNSTTTPSSISTSQGHGRPFESASVTSGSASLTKDHGISAWIDFVPASNMKFEVGYSRSVSYGLNTVFFSLFFDFSSAFHRSR